MEYTRRLRRELKDLERGIQFLDDSRKRMEDMLRDLGTLAGCNMYVNYTTLRMEAQDAIDHFHSVMKSQMTLTQQSLTELYNQALKTHRD
jgi:hypothetical protein